MLELLQLAVLNTARNVRRTIITLLSIVVGFSALACFGGFIEFSFEGLRETTIRTQIGHIQIFADGYEEGHVAEPERFLIDQPEAVEDALADIAGIATITRRLTYSGLASVGSGTASVRVTGIAPDREDEFTDFETLIDGRQIRRGDKDAGVIGQGLQKGLGAEVGDWVTVVNSTVEGMINAIDFQIVGVVSTGSEEYDNVFAKVPIELAQRARETDKVERIIVLLHDTADVPRVSVEVAERLGTLGRSFETKLWHELAGFYSDVVALYTGIFTVFAVIVGIVVMFSVANTITMAVFERTSEVGAMRALGARRALIVWMFLLEGLVVGLIGTVLGILVSYGVSFGVTQLGGIPIPAPPGMSRGFQAYFLLTPRILSIAVVVMMGAAVVSSVYPAFSASRLKIVEALTRR